MPLVFLALGFISLLGEDGCMKTAVQDQSRKGHKACLTMQPVTGFFFGEGLKE